MPSRRANTRWPASWTAMSSPRPTTVNRMESTARQCTRCIPAAQELRSATDLGFAEANPPRLSASAFCSLPGSSKLAALSGFGPAEVVAQDLGVVEAEVLPGDVGFGAPARVLRVVAGLQRAGADPAGVHRRDGVLARVPPRVGVGEELLDQLHLEAGLLARLAPAGAAQLLAIVHEAARQGPAARLVLAQDEHYPPVGAGDDGVRGGQRVLVLGHQGVISPPGVAGTAGVSAGFCQRPSSAWLKSARQNGFCAPSSPCSRSRETASAVRAASTLPSEASTWAIS